MDEFHSIVHSLGFGQEQLRKKGYNYDNGEPFECSSFFNVLIDV